MSKAALYNLVTLSKGKDFPPNLRLSMLKLRFSGVNVTF